MSHLKPRLLKPDQEEVAPQTEPVKTYRVRGIPYFQVLNNDGQPVVELPDWAQRKNPLVALYKVMLKTRLFDQKAVALQRRGQLGTYASSLGQEAIGAAIGCSMQTDDVLFPAYREYAAQFSRGVSMTEILLYWGGNEQGMNFQHQDKDFPICVPIASHVPHAAGTAYAMKYRGQRRVSVCVFGDGATSKGDFYEALNAAGSMDLPLVFVINNNQWAISFSRKHQSKALTLAHKSVAAGIPGEQVDGNDVIALRQRIGRALENARDGRGPTLIEALTYRLCDHTTADNADRYRDSEEVKKQWVNDPLVRLRKHMQLLGFWSDQEEKDLNSRYLVEVEQATRAYLQTPPQPISSMFDYLYKSLPDALNEQRSAAMDQGHQSG